MLIPWFRLEPIDIPGPIDIQPFGILVALGILVGSRVAEWRGEKLGVPREVVTSFLFFVIVIGLLSAMLLNMVMYEPEKFAALFSGEFTYPGLSSFGGLFGGTLAALYYRKRHQVSIMVLGDIFCYAFPFAWFFGRMGCFVVHDHPGLPSEFILAVDNYYQSGIARHDLGFYEVLWSAAAALLALALGRQPRPFGFFMGVIPMFYAVVRFGLDFLREVPANHGDVRYFGLTPGHYWSVIMFVVALLVLLRSLRNPSSGSVYLSGAPAAADQSASGRLNPATAPTLRSSPPSAPAGKQAEHSSRPPATKSGKRSKRGA